MTEAARNVLSSENVEVLEAGTSVRDFIDRTVERLSSEGSEGPFFVADLDSVARRHLRWIRNLPGVKPFYAVKCNSSPAVIRTLNALGTGFDCASKGEIQLALSLGVSPENIIFAHTTKPPSHLRFACSHGVNLMTFDSEEELTKISQCHSNAKLVLRLAVDDSAARTRLSVKFGARREEVDRLLRRTLELDLDLTGVSFHVGCMCTDVMAFRKAIADARQVFDAATSLGLQMNFLDIGGGFAGTDDFQVTFEDASDAIKAALEEYFPADSGVQVIAEPGRYFVQSAFTLATRIIAKRAVEQEADECCDDEDENDTNKTVMYYVSDGVYGSISCLINDADNAKVEPFPQRAVGGGERSYRSVVWGPTCDSLDRVSADVRLPELAVGEWLLLDAMGAYSLTLSTGFNGFGNAAVYPVVSAETCRALKLCSA
ncbi:uncharacterized protein V6R79_014842 [Siganus canaliculatus]